MSAPTISPVALAAFVWRLLRRFQWRIAWLLQSKFVICTTCLVRDESGRVLLLRHRFWPPGRQVGLPSGYAKSGERLEDAVTREVREETGLRVRVTHVVQVSSGYRLRIEAAFAADLTGGDWALDHREVLDGSFVALDELPADLMPDHRRMIEEHADWFAEQRSPDAAV